MAINIPLFRLLLMFLGILSFSSVYALELSPTSLEITAGNTKSITIAKISGTVSVKSSNTAVATVLLFHG